jgi:hypothetical protein
MHWRRTGLPLLAVVVGTTLAACTSATTTGAGTPAVATGATSPTTTAPAVSSTSAASSSSRPASPTVTIHPAPATPVRSATVHGASTTYPITVWFEVSDHNCAAHAYGRPMIAFLTAHPCFGMTRQLLTTTVHGRPVGVSVVSTGFPGSPQNPYADTEAFRRLVEQDGTGSIADLMREGYRLPSGPTAIPSPDAFATVGQDAGVDVFDMWYLTGPTPMNDPALVRMAQEIFLQY